MALLLVAGRPLDVTGETAVILGEPDTRSARVSMLEAVRALERRGLVELERAPSPNGGWGRLLVSARPAARELPDLTAGARGAD